MTINSGYDDFIDALKKYKKLITWVTVSSIALPLAASQVDITPPWPKGVVLLTSLVQIVVAVAAFQLSQISHRKYVSIMTVLLTIGVLLISIIYISALSGLTFYGGPAKERQIKGLVCSDEAMSIPAYKQKCPLLTDDLISSAERADQLWTPVSITYSRVVMLTLWLGSVAMFSALLVMFITFQSRTKGRFISAEARKKK